jgi:hypothetical protein
MFAVLPLSTPIAMSASVNAGVPLPQLPVDQGEEHRQFRRRFEEYSTALINQNLSRWRNRRQEDLARRQEAGFTATPLATRPRLQSADDFRAAAIDSQDQIWAQFQHTQERMQDSNYKAMQSRSSYKPSRAHYTIQNNENGLD